MSLARWQLSSVLKNPNLWLNTFSPIGFVWTVWQVLESYDPNLTIITVLSPWLLWSLLLIPLGAMFSGFLIWPSKKFSRKLPNIDTTIEVQIGDIFSSNSPMVVTIPTTLECTFDDEIISKKSIHGQFIVKYCKQRPEVLRDAIKNASKDTQELANEPNAFSNGQCVARYDVGEVWTLRNFDRLAYAATFSTFNGSGKAQVSEEDYTRFLQRLWSNIRERGDSEALDVTLMGGTTARTHHHRLKDVLRDLVSSFSAACSEGLVVRKLSIFISPKDYESGELTPQFIERMLENACDDHLGWMIRVSEIGTPV